MIASVVIGSGNKRQSFALPCSSNRKDHVDQRIKFGNVLKSKYLFAQGGFAAAKSRGERALQGAN